MKQQFLELIDRYIAQGNWDEKQLCRQIRQEIEKMNEWIPVTERLPEYDVYVLTFEEGSMEVGILWENYGFVDGREHMEITPTHWMPLPNPPTI